MNKKTNSADNELYVKAKAFAVAAAGEKKELIPWFFAQALILAQEKPSPRQQTLLQEPRFNALLQQNMTDLASNHNAGTETSVAVSHHSSLLVRGAFPPHSGVEIVGENGSQLANQPRNCVAVLGTINGNFELIGSGVLIAADRVLTARHVAQDANVLAVSAATSVLLSNFSPINATFEPVGDVDMAVLHLEEALPNVTPANLDQDNAQIADPVIAGYGIDNLGQLGRRHSGRATVQNMTADIISVAPVNLQQPIGNQPQPGDSGGPLYSSGPNGTVVAGILQGQDLLGNFVYNRVFAHLAAINAAM